MKALATGYVAYYRVVAGPASPAGITRFSSVPYATVLLAGRAVARVLAFNDRAGRTVSAVIRAESVPASIIIGKE